MALLNSWSFIVFLGIFIAKSIATCPEGWELNENFCYYIGKKNLTWSEANEFCLSKNAELASISTKAEQEWLVKNSVGLSESQWWIKAKSNQPCVALRASFSAAEFEETDCSATRSYICKTPFSVKAEACDTDRGFNQIGDNCFKMVEEEKNWHEANDHCLKNYNSYLASVVNEEEQIYISSSVTQTGESLWIGLSDTISPTVFEWSNGHDQLMYNKWATNQPNITVPGSMCVMSRSDLNGDWAAMRCRDEQKFVCKKGKQESCPDGWTYANGKCYQFYTNSNLFLTWTEANTFCESQNARLLKVETPEESAFIANYYSEWKELGILQIWLGISDVLQDGVLLWSDGSTVMYSEWDVDLADANNPGVDDCAWLYTGKSDHNWEIGDCFLIQAYACEIAEGVSLSPFPKPTLNYKCYDGWRLHSDHCYLFDTTQRGWDDAEQFCQSEDRHFGHLASIHDESEQSFMSGNLRGQSWIGMTDRITEGTWIWSDGTPSDFFNWKINQPSQDGDCMRLIGVDDENQWGTWNDRSCAETIYPICKVPALSTSPTTPTKPSTPNENPCDDGYVHYSGNHKCFKLVPDHKRTWSDARLHCQQEGGDLAGINSPEEQAFVEFHTSFVSVGSLWVGAEDSYNGPDGLPSIIAGSFDGGWRWIDGSPFNYVNWAPGEPNTLGDEDCVEFYTAEGFWNDILCNNLRGYICEKPDPLHEEPVADCTSADCCFRHLGVEIGGEIPDDQLSVSSQLDEVSGANRGRLNTMDQYTDALGLGGLGRGAWIAAENDPAPWFKVDFIEWREVRGVVSQGRNGLSQPHNQNDWVRQYSIQYMVNPILGVFEDYKELDESVKIFDGNFDQNTQITNVFTRPIVTTSIKILPTDCRKKCAMRIEFIGCKPTCTSSLGISTNSITHDFPILDNQQFSASSQQTGYEAYNARLDYVDGDGIDTTHVVLDYSTLTYDTAKQYCVDQGSDLCSKAEICPNGVPIITGALSGDQWAPIRDAYNDWVELGNDDDPNGGRVCYQHNAHYDPPSWGTTAGDCPPWNLKQGCDLKGNVFCCAVNTKSWKPTQNSNNQWLQVDFGGYRKISGVLVQGDVMSDDWIKSYYLSFSDDGQTFFTYKTPSGDPELFPGCVDRLTPVEGYLREPIATRYLRVLPQSWNNNIALRMDVVGCNVDDRGDCTDRANSYPDDTFTITCPGGCDSISDQLWGTGIYTDDSYICAAAIHDGRIINDHGGTVTVKKLAGQSSYTGSVQHGLTSSDRGATDGAITFQSDHLGCPTGWDGWQDWCYYLTRKSSNVDHAAARQRCQSYGGDLVSIHSQAEQNFVENLVFFGYGSIQHVWIGMTDNERTNYFKWEDGSEVTYTMWDFNEPNGGEIEHCVQMYKWSGFWNDVSCDYIMNYMCKMDKIPVNQDEVVISGCPTGWVGWETSCYLFDVSPSVWTNAEDYCSKQGGHLASIGSYYEQMFITGQASQTSHPDDQENFYIGLGAFVGSDGALSFRWSSGEPVTFTAWGKDEPLIFHQCVFPFQFEGVEYYNCISIGRPYELLGGPWCSGDAIYDNHPIPCEGMEDGQVGCIVLDKDTGYWSQANPIGCGSPEYRICEIPRQGVTTPAIPTLPSPNGNCPVGWYANVSSTFCYQINEQLDDTQRLSWEESKRHCESQGATLVSIHSSQEEQVIASGIAGLDSYSFWIGLKRLEDGQLGWADKTPLSYTNWADGEPNNHNGRENCVEASFAPDYNKWNDLNCDAVRNWICKIERGKDLLPAVTPPPGTLSPAICGDDQDWVAYTSTYTNIQKCYYFASTPLKGWASASTFCKSLGGFLVSISSLDEQAFITGRAAKTGISDLWIGLVQDTINGPYIWEDGTPLTFENWHGSGQPNNDFGQELCVNIEGNTGLWSDANCGLTEGFICQKYPDGRPVTPDPTPVAAGGCPYNWVPYGGKCFLTVGIADTSLKNTWENAEAYCQEQKGNLASIPNEYYSAFITSQLFAFQSNAWIGLNSRGTDLTFKWSDNEEVLFTNWDSSEPNNSEGAEECVEIRWQNDHAGKWNDQSCNENLPFICSRTKDPDFPPDYQSDSTICPEGYGFVQWDTGCYKFYSDHSDYKTWDDAQTKCHNDGVTMGYPMELTSIWNVYENHALLSLFWPQEGETKPFEDMWIGLYYEYNYTTGAASYNWVDQSPVVYTAWGTNEPQIPPANVGCVVMNKYGTWGLSYTDGYMTTCGQTTLPFVCKYETLTMPTPDPNVEGTCEGGWAMLGDYCYKVTTGENNLDLRTWGDADRECQNQMAYLASIHSDFETKAFLSWTAHKSVWIGLTRNGWGGWEWIDNTGLDYTNWDDGEPNDAGEANEACVEFRQSGAWNDKNCNEQMGHICKKHKTYSTCNFPTDEREDCGYEGITNYECVTRGCCWDETGTGPHTCFYSRADAACIEKGGVCKDYRYNICELGYETNLCSLGSENQCCFTCDADDTECNAQVDQWEEGDEQCEAGGYGACQYDTNFCENFYETGKCGGPAERRCCVLKPNTKPPDPNPTTTTSAGQKPPTDPGVVTTTMPPPVTTTTASQGTGPTKEPVSNDNGGLDGGAIAGIIIAVLFVVVGAGVAFFLFKRGDAKLPLLSSSPKQSSVSGFDNPITFSKDTVTMDAGVEYDA